MLDRFYQDILSRQLLAYPRSKKDLFYPYHQSHLSRLFGNLIGSKLSLLFYDQILKFYCANINDTADNIHISMQLYVDKDRWINM